MNGAKQVKPSVFRDVEKYTESEKSGHFVLKLPSFNFDFEKHGSIKETKISFLTNIKCRLKYCAYETWHDRTQNSQRCSFYVILRTRLSCVQYLPCLVLPLRYILSSFKISNS